MGHGAKNAQSIHLCAFVKPLHLDLELSYTPRRCIRALRPRKWPSSNLDGGHSCGDSKRAVRAARFLGYPCSQDNVRWQHYEKFVPLSCKVLSLPALSCLSEKLGRTHYLTPTDPQSGVACLIGSHQTRASSDSHTTSSAAEEQCELLLEGIDQVNEFVNADTFLGYDLLQLGESTTFVTSS